MSEGPDFRSPDPENFADLQVAEGDVESAARSCSAILIIAVVIGLILCAALALAQLV